MATQEQVNLFIEQIAPLIQKYAPLYGINVVSPIIAQAILESASGTSDKVFKDGEWRHNYFGLKWHNNRCAVSNDYFEEITSEQNPDGSYKVEVAKFFKFKSMEDGVLGYFQFTNISNYANLKGVTDPRQYLENIKSDKYATSLDYVSKVMNVIEKYNLTVYDSQIEVVEPKMVINVHAGHNPDGKIACGAVGLIKESTEARKVRDKVITYLTQLGHTVYDCTCEDGTSVADVLNKIVAKCNEHKADIDVSIHYNAGGGKGTEVLVYNKTSQSYQTAANIVSAISELGFANRGIKERPELAVLRRTTAPALLVECCFVDSEEDTKRLDVDLMAKAIVKGITGTEVEAKAEVEEKPFVICPHCGGKVVIKWS